MDPALKNALKVGISFAVLLGFISMWLWLSREMWQFKPSQGKPRLEVDPVFASLAGLLSTTVATATAAVLGFEAQTPLQLGQSWWQVVKSLLRKAFSTAGLLAVGCVSYVAVGCLVIVVYLANRAEAPETVSAFYLSAVGWALGAFSSTFQDPPVVEAVTAPST